MAQPIDYAAIAAKVRQGAAPAPNASGGVTPIDYAAMADKVRQGTPAPALAPAQPDDPNTFGTYVKHLWSGVNPVQIGQLLPFPKLLGGSGMDNPLNPITMLRGLNTVRADANARMQRGDYPGALAKYVESVVPVIGPLMSHMGDEAEQGKWSAMLGDATALAAQMASGKVSELPNMRVRVPALMRNKNPVQAAAVRAGMDAGIPVDLATASGSPMVRAVQQANEFTPVGAITEYFAKPKREAALTAEATRLSDAVSPTRYDPADVGTSVVATTQKAIDALTDTANTQYDTFRAVGGTQPVDVAAAQAKLEPLYQRMVRESRLAPPMGADAANLRALDRFMQFTPNTATLADVDQALRGLKKLERENGGAVRLQVRAIEAQVQAAAQAAGQPAVDALRAGRDAIKARVPLQDTLDQFTKGGATFEPANAYRKLVRKDDTGLAFLQAIERVDPDLPKQAGRAWLETHLDPVTSGGGFEHVDKLVAEWNKVGPLSKPILFGGPANVQALDQLMRLAKELNTAHNKSGTATMQMAAGSLAVTGGGLITAPGLTVLGLLGSGALTAIMKNPAAVRLLTQGMSKLIGPGRSAAPALAKAAQAAATANILSARKLAGVEEQ